MEMMIAMFLTIIITVTMTVMMTTILLTTNFCHKNDHDDDAIDDSVHNDISDDKDDNHDDNDDDDVQDSGKAYFTSFLYNIILNFRNKAQPLPASSASKSVYFCSASKPKESNSPSGLSKIAVGVFKEARFFDQLCKDQNLQFSSFSAYAQSFHF